MISGPSSYPSTIAEFLAHWTQANDAWGGGAAVTLAEGVSRDDLMAHQADLDDARGKVTDAGVDRTLAREQLTDLVRRLQGRLVEFNGRLRADLPGKPLSRIVPDAFSVGDAESGVRETLRQMERIWTKVNALSPAPAGLTLPLALQEGYTLALFTADREALRLAYGALTNADVELRSAREERNDLQEVIYPILKNYRLKVPVLFPAGHAVVASLPKLTPETGRTPAPVVAEAVWDAAAEKAKITWEASADDDLAEYQVRGVPGDDYETQDETVLATVPAGGTREVLTAFALGTPGLITGYKVYVVLTTGHEKGSEAVYVTRPV